MLGSLFLVPGLAAAQTGAGVLLVYPLAGVLVLPALASLAELGTAMPRAGGPYYYLDRTLGPLVGTIGGIGAWLVLIFKSAFGLIGIGWYLSLVIDVPPVPIAVGVALLFVLLNVVGARESTRLLRAFVLAVLAVVVTFLVWVLPAGGRSAAAVGTGAPLLPGGADGLLAALGIVFVMFVGLVKTTSLAEEIRKPERNLPAGLGLAVLTVTVLYTLGVAAMIGALGPADLAMSVTPVADAALAVGGLPDGLIRGIVVAGAVAAFGAMANAGMLSASRYPLALARDRIFPDWLAGTWHGTVPAVLLTGGLMVAALVTLDVEAVAKLGSALLLLLLGLLNVAVIVMRESGIEAYDPGYRSPLYPWTQLVGLFVSLVLVAEMGWLPVLFTVGVTVLAVGWYNSYARARIAREGAIYHVFERLARRRDAGLEGELRDIMKEKGARAADPFDEVVTRGDVVDQDGPLPLRDLVADAARQLALRAPMTAAELEEGFAAGLRAGGAPVARGAALIHTRIPGFEGSELLLARVRGGVLVGEENQRALPGRITPAPIRALFFLVSGQQDPGRHLRILAQIAGRVEDDGFMDEWLRSRHEHALKEVLLRNDRFLTLRVTRGRATAPLIGQALRDLSMPAASLVALIRRGGTNIVPHGQTVLQEGDRLTIIGEPHGLRELKERYSD